MSYIICLLYEKLYSANMKGKNQASEFFMEGDMENGNSRIMEGNGKDGKTEKVVSDSTLVFLGWGLVNGLI